LAVVLRECQYLDRQSGEETVPTYQYRCTECSHDLEVVQSFSDAALSECPACSGRLRKVFSSVGVVFKGSGFYKTDSRSGSSATAPAQRGKDAPSDGASKDTSRTESSPSSGDTSSSGSSTGAGGSSSSTSGGSSSGSSTNTASATAA
jgi:putative FmdB family regulatory protein